MSTTGCSHNFCSVCVRNYLTFQQNCPKCLTEMHETQIKPNKVLQEVISLFRLFIPKIAEMVSTKKSVTSSQKNVAKNHNVSQSFNVSSSASKFDVSDLQESSQEPSHSFNGQNHSGSKIKNKFKFSRVKCFFLMPCKNSFPSKHIGSNVIIVGH